MTLAKISNLIARFAGIGALAIGLALWSGRLYELLALHMVLGFSVVISLWVLAAIAFTRGIAKGASCTAVLWGLVTMVLGVGQSSLLQGDQHWIAQDAHLVIGIGAITLAASLGRKVIAIDTDDRVHS